MATPDDYAQLIVPAADDGVLRAHVGGLGGTSPTNIRLVSSRAAASAGPAPIPRWLWLVAGGIALLAIATKG